MHPVPSATILSLDNSTLRWFVWLRWFAGLGVGSVFALELLSRERFSSSISVLCATGFVLFISNLIVHLRFARGRELSRPVLCLLLVLDIVLLTIVLAITGGPANPFSVLYLVHITLTAVLLSSSWTWAMALGAIVAYGSLFIWIDPHSAHQMGSYSEHGAEMSGFSEHLKGMWLAFAIAAVLISYFVTRILSSLKDRDREVSDMRLAVEQNTRFASLVTLAAGAAHELGSPLSTIAVIVQDLLAGSVDQTEGDSVKKDYLLLNAQVARCKKILDELRRLLALQQEIFRNAEANLVGVKGFYKGLVAASLKAAFGCYIYFTGLRYF